MKDLIKKAKEEVVMLDYVEKQLEIANKLIFVKSYNEADQILQEVSEDSQGRINFLVQFRRVELALKLGKLEKLKDYFLSQYNLFPEEAQIWEICIAFADQHGENVSDIESAITFQEIMKRFTPNSAAFFGLAFSMESQKNFDRAIYNYEQSLKLDPNWYPAYFGLSQIYYQQNEEKKGDHYFYLFEKLAPFNLYGNFETHRSLSLEYIDKEDYNAALNAISTLSEWWLDHKGICPAEIQIYEKLAYAKIFYVKGETSKADAQNRRAMQIAEQKLIDPSTKEEVLYFIAKILEEYSELEMAFRYYKAILKSASTDASTIQKIATQFLTNDEPELADALFDEAYQANPNNSEIRFCRLVTKLKINNVNVEEYLMGRERLGKIYSSRNGDKVELLTLLHSLMAKFKYDAEVHSYVANLYLDLGNSEKASKHFAIMYEIDSLSDKTSVKYASFLLNSGKHKESYQILKRINADKVEPAELKSEVEWLKANYYVLEKDYDEALKLIKSSLKSDPWNISYLIKEIICITHLQKEKDDNLIIDDVLIKLSKNDENDLNWDQFDTNTEKLIKNFNYSLVYSRSKLSFLYSHANQRALLKVTRAAGLFNAQQGIYDFLRLINTNFDSPAVFMSLGFLFKDLWQLESATLWFNQTLEHPLASEKIKYDAYLELADCYTWQNKELSKATAFAKMVLDSKKSNSIKANTVLAHAYLKSGMIQESQSYLDHHKNSTNFEVLYLQGLCHYRNGSKKRANSIWKPLLTVPSKNLKSHYIKQEILRYYFDQEPYANTPQNLVN